MRASSRVPIMMGFVIEGAHYYKKEPTKLKTVLAYETGNGRKTGIISTWEW